MASKDPFYSAMEGKSVDQKLQFLYHRRQALDNLIRSLESERRKYASGEGKVSEKSSFWPTVAA